MASSVRRLRRLERGDLARTSPWPSHADYKYVVAMTRVR